MRRALAAALTLATALLAAPVAQADPDPLDQRPWAAGTTPERREAALARFQVANQAFAENDYPTAIAEYQQALADWPHPAIEGNLAVALIHVDRVVEAFEHLERAFAFGPAPFEPEAWSQLQTLHQALTGQIARLEVTGALDGVAVLLDGADLPSGAARTIRAGSHELAARRPGYLTYTQRIDAPPSQTTTIHIALVPLALAGTLERRWAPWKPWAVVAAGATVTALGVGLELAARGNVDAYEREVGRACPAGCPPSDLSDAVRGLEARARWQDRVGVPAIALGAVTLVVGGALVGLDLPRRTRVDESGRRISLAPVLAPGTVGVLARLGF